MTLSVSPGTFNVSTLLIIEEGVSLNDSSVVSEVGITDQVLVTSAGQGTIIRPSEQVTINRPLNISLPLSGSTKLNLADSVSYAVFYKYQEKDTGRLITGVFPVDNKIAFLKFDETIQRDVIQFEGYFGEYWPVIISRPLTVGEVPAAKESTIPIVNKSLATVITTAGVVNEAVIVKTQASVALKIEKVGLVLNLANRSFAVNAEIDKNFVSCKVDISENVSALKTSTFDTDANFSYTGPIVKAIAHQLLARFRCLDANGKMIISAWSDAVAVPAITIGSTSPTGTTGGTAPASGATPAVYSKISVAADGYINDAEKSIPGAIWAIFDSSGGAISFSTALWNNSNALICDASQTYSQTSVPLVNSLTIDGAWSACARIQASDGSVTFVKAETVVRDTSAPVFTSLLAANQASDGFINNNERISTLVAWSLQASAYDAVNYSVAIADTGSNLACTSTVSYSQNTIPTIASITADGLWAMCVVLNDNAGNKTYGKASQVNRRTPIFTLGFSGLTTSDQTPPLTGTVSIPDATVTFLVNGASYVATTNANGTWTIADNVLTTLAHNYYDVTISATDTAGNTASLDVPQSLKIISNTFISSWKTDNSGISNSNQIKLPLQSNGTYNFSVDWGDGTTDTITNYLAAAATHTYSAPGTYTVTISGTITGWRFVDGGDKLKLLNISVWGPFRFGNDESYFQGASNLTITAADRPSLSGTTKFYKAFAGCTSITTIPNLEKWSMGAVTSLEAMFRGATQFNQNLNSWNVSAVTDFREVFSGATVFNGNVSAWDVSNGTLFNGMFLDAWAFNQDVSLWNMSSATSLLAMFQGTRAFNKNLNSWNVANVTNFANVFRDASEFNGNISGWQTTSATDMSSMFQLASKFNQSLNAWNVATVTNMSGMFQGATLFNQNLNSWNTASVTNMAGMFAAASNFNQNLTLWVVNNVTNMSNMFHGATLFNGDITSWNTIAAVDMSGMFGNTQMFNQNISGWNVANVMYMNSMFEGAAAFNQNINTWDVRNVRRFSRMFTLATAFNSPLNLWVTQTATEMSEMFKGAVLFNQPINNFNVSTVTTMLGMFEGATSFNQSLNNWNVALVSDFKNMFAGATAFNGNIISWNTSSALSMREMFRGASSFNADISGWIVTNVTDMSGMFSLAMAFNRNLASWAVQNVTNMDGIFYSITLSTANYDALLIAWSGKALRSSVLFYGGNSKYSAGSAANARALMVSNFMWTIIDGGLAN